jgi:lipoprotein-anchoring transpeptidase ErfK/SrfK
MRHEIAIPTRTRHRSRLSRLVGASLGGAVAGIVVLAAMPAPVSEATPPLVGPTSDAFPAQVLPEPLALPRVPAVVITAKAPSLSVYANPSTSSTLVGAFANPTELGTPLVLLATMTNGEWIQADLPERPNGITGWVRSADVSLASDPYHLVVSLGARQLALFDGKSSMLVANVSPGEPWSPTPMGSFFISEVVQLTDPTTAYGPYALLTSAFSDTYESFDGGPGQVAIHGTNQPWLIGGYASHGCVRLNNADISALAHQVPAGTPLDIVP